MNYVKGALLILTLTAVVYGTQDVWSQEVYTSALAQPMDVDTGGTRFTGGGGAGPPGR